MNNPTELKYAKSHEWLRYENGVAVIGISDFAQKALGDVVYIGLPEVGAQVTAGESFGDVESVKAVSDLICPVTGVICAVNAAVSFFFRVSFCLLSDTPVTRTGFVLLRHVTLPALIKF